MRGDVEDKPEPFVLYMGRRFAAKAVKTFGLGVIARKIMVEILKRMGVQLKDRAIIVYCHLLLDAIIHFY